MLHYSCKTQLCDKDPSANPSCWCCSGGTALHAAVRQDAGRAVQVLLDNAADINVLSNDGYAPLHEAAAKPELAELLLEHGADPKIQNSHNHLQPLHMAARHGSSDVCRLLLSAGADVTAASKDGSTPLHEAAEHAQAHIIELLMANGAACMAEDKHHRTPLSVALRTSFASDAPDAANKLVASVTTLLSHWQDGTGTRDKKQAWPELTEAAIGGHTAVVQLLLNRGASASDAALTVASQTGHLEVVKLLLRHRGSAKQASGDEPNALHMAARFGHVEVAELLLAKGADTEGAFHTAVLLLCFAILCTVCRACGVSSKPGSCQQPVVSHTHHLKLDQFNMYALLTVLSPALAHLSQCRCGRSA